MTLQRDYFHTDDQQTVHYLANVLLTAHDELQAIRFNVVNGHLFVKRGHSGWVELHGTPDPYRETKEI